MGKHWLDRFSEAGRKSMCRVVRMGRHLEGRVVWAGKHRLGSLGWWGIGVWWGWLRVQVYAHGGAG